MLHVTRSLLRIAVRVLFIVLLLTARGVYTAIEQPMSSTFKLLPPYLKIKELFDDFIHPFYQSFL